MMNVIFALLLSGGILFGAITGRTEQVSAALLTEGESAVKLAFSLMGSFCFWGGIMEIAKRSGLTDKIAKALLPITGRLFGGIARNGAAMKAVSMNITANLLGLGNAATPLGINAMKSLKREENAKDRATDNMALFVVINTASLQLIPTTTAMLRAAAGSKSPFDIIPAVWCASLAAAAVGVSAAKLMAAGGKRHG